MGRPSSYTDEIAAEICALMVDGLSLRQICRKDEMPSIRSIMRWLGDKDNDIFRQQYAMAKEQQAESYANEIIDIADDDGRDELSPQAIQRAKLKVDARKWVAAKLLPKKYGDRTELVGAGGKDLIPAEVDNTKLALVLMAILEGKKPAETKG